jgi:hypothetical protein
VSLVVELEDVEFADQGTFLADRPSVDVQAQPTSGSVVPSKGRRECFAALRSESPGSVHGSRVALKSVQ